MSNFFEKTEGDFSPNFFGKRVPVESDKAKCKRRVETDSAVSPAPRRTTPDRVAETILSAPKEDIVTMPASSESLAQTDATPKIGCTFGTTSGGGGMNNFFNDPEIKLKLKKADGIPTMTEFVQEVAKPLAIKWEKFGLSLGIQPTFLEAIEQRNSSRDPSDPHSFIEVFKEWETNKSGFYKPCTWTTIVDILKHSLDQHKIADIIERKFTSQDKESTDFSQRSDGSGFSSLPSSLNQTTTGSSLSDPFNQYSSRSNTQSPPSTLPDVASLSPTRRSRPYVSSSATTTTVLPSPEYPYNTSNAPVTDSSSSHFGSEVVSQPQDNLSVFSVPSYPEHEYSSLRYTSPFDGQLHSSPSQYNQTGQIPRGGFPPPKHNPYFYSTSFDSFSQHSEISTATTTTSYSGQHASVPPYHYPQYPGLPTTFTNPSEYPAHNYNQLQVPQGYSHSLPTFPGSPVTSTSQRPASVDPNGPLGDARDHSSDSSYHSAIESIKKYDEASFTELIQKYMKELENRQDVANTRHAEKTLPILKVKEIDSETEERESLTQKELEKAYERISSLEVRIQDLTMQSNIEIPEDHEVSYMQKDKLEQEFRRMREFKRQAEKQNMEAKQTTQRLVAENSRLKEELALVKNDREMIVNQLKREIKRAKERNDHSKEILDISTQELKEKIAQRYSTMVASASSVPRNSNLIKVADLPPLKVTPHEFNNILGTQKGNLSLGLVVIAGLPACGKTTLLQSLLENENPKKPWKARGEETCLQVHELLVTKNPLTEASEWASAPGLESAVYLLSTIVAQYCFRNKGHPTFPPIENLEKEVKSIPSLQDRDVQQHFIRVYKAVKSLIEDKAKTDSLSELALFQPAFFNIWDMGVNRALYQFLGSGASQIKRLVMVVFLDLERDVPRLDSPPDLMSKKSYAVHGDDTIVMKVHSRLQYLLILAGLKRWFKPIPSNKSAPEALIVGLHTKEFASINEGKKLQESVDLLQRSILVEAEKMGISGVLVPKISTYCSDSDDQAGELAKLKAKIEQLVSSQPHSSTVFDAKSIFLRSLLYGEDKPLFVNRREMAKLAHKCSIYFEDELNPFLTNCRDVGSVMFYPRSMNPFLHNKIALDVVKPLRLLDRLYYLLTYSESKAIEPLSTEDMEQYQYGMISKRLAMKLFKEAEDVDTFLRFLSEIEECVDISLSGQQEKYFFPYIRRDVNKSAPSKYSLFIKYSTHFVHSACITLYVKFLKDFFEMPSEALLSHTKQYNTVVFKIYKTPSSKAIDVLVINHLREQFIEVRIPDLEKNVDIDLCSKFVRLSHKVFEYLSAHLQYLEFKLCVKCPESDLHFAEFFLNYHATEVYCKDCRKLVKVNDNRLCWLS